MQRLVALELSPGLVPANATGRLWDALEAELRGRSGRASLAPLVPLRDGLWFASSGGEVLGSVRSLVAYLDHLVAELLEDDGEACRLRVDASDDGASAGAASQAVQRWRWISARLPPSLLLAGLSWRRGTPLRDGVALLPGHVERLLRESPVAELHLHVGAGPSFDVLWDALMEAPEPRPFDSDAPLGPRFAMVLQATSFARRLLTMHAVAAEPRVSIDERLRRHSEQLARWRGGRTIDWWRDGLAILDVLDADHENHAQVRARADQAAPRDLLSRVRWLKRALERFGPTRPTIGHAALVRSLLSAVASEHCDGRLRRLFWQYVRVHALLYRFLVNDPAACGLDWFSRHYRRISGVTAETLRRQRLVKTLRNDGAGINLACLEIRTAPEDTWEKIRRETQSYAREVSTLDRAPEWGIVFHLVKAHIVKLARVDAPTMSGRYGEWFRTARTQLRALDAMLALDPALQCVVRGIDVANVELAVPTWIVAPLFRETLTKAARRSSSERPPLHTTPHVGEDFRRLAEGLRRLDEALALELVGRRSRVGHALALGIDPVRWRDHHPVVSQPAEERLFDLLWECTLLERGMSRPSAARVGQVHAEARRLGTELFGAPASVEALVDAYRQLRRPGVVMQAGYGRPVGRIADDDYVRRWLFDGQVQRRGAMPVAVVATSDEVRMLEEAQLAVARAYVNAGIVVECNLSSNLLVGGLESFAAHPMLRWQPLDNAADLPRMGITINSDDPVTFATRLADEYAYAYYALLHAGATNDQALGWLDQVRRMGWLTRFTVPASADRTLMRRLGGHSR